MKIHRAWIRATAAVAMAAGTQIAVGQFPDAVGPRYAAPSSSAPSEGPYSATQYPSTSAYPTTDQAAAVQEQSPYPTTQAANPQTQPAEASAYPQYQAPHTASLSPYSTLALETSADAAPQNGTVVTPPQDNMLPSPAAPMNGNTPANGNSAAPMNGSYYGNNCNTGGYYGNYYNYPYGPGNTPDYGLGTYMAEEDGGSALFGGVYGLGMTRSKPGYQRYTVGVDSGATGTPYFPVAADTLIDSSADPDWREGYEIRLGFTFDCGNDAGYDDYGYGCGNNCGCESGCTQTYAMEFAFWTLDRDIQSQQVDDTLVGTFRYYGMINYAGLEYDDGGGVQDVNVYYNYQVPITGTGTETVLAQRVRTNFWARDFELNVLRLPLFSGCASSGGCDPAAPPFTMTGLCGVRYFRMDDDFEFATEWDTGGGAFDGWDYDSANELYHDIQMENNLVGFQLGANMNYWMAARWNAFWDTNFGLYNNYVTQYQRIYNGAGGAVVFTQDGRDATVRSHKDDVAFLGEMRMGGAYNFSGGWRGVLAYRAVAISGVALSTDQIQPNYSNWADTARINADGSIIIHGVQAGLECVY